jgi:uncharacterized protein (DUF4415 family)
MIEKKLGMKRPWTDPDDAPELDEHFFAHAEIRDGKKVIRPATGTLTKRGRPKSHDPKQQVTLRLDRMVLERFRATGPGWQSRINDELKRALGI